MAIRSMANLRCNICQETRVNYEALREAFTSRATVIKSE